MQAMAQVWAHPEDLPLYPVSTQEQCVIHAPWSGLLNRQDSLAGRGVCITLSHATPQQMLVQHYAEGYGRGNGFWTNILRRLIVVAAGSGGASAEAAQQEREAPEQRVCGLRGRGPAAPRHQRPPEQGGRGHLPSLPSRSPAQGKPFPAWLPLLLHGKALSSACM